MTGQVCGVYGFPCHGMFTQDAEVCWEFQDLVNGEFHGLLIMYRYDLVSGRCD